MKYICLVILWVHFASTVESHVWCFFNANGPTVVRPQGLFSCHCRLGTGKDQVEAQGYFCWHGLNLYIPGFQSPPGYSTQCYPVRNIYIYNINLHGCRHGILCFFCDPNHSLDPSQPPGIHLRCSSRWSFRSERHDCRLLDIKGKEKLEVKPLKDDGWCTSD